MNLTIPGRSSSKQPAEGVGHMLNDAKRALSHEAEHLAEVAAQLGRDAGKQVSKVSQDTGKQASEVADEASATASSLAQRFMRGASKWGNQIASSGRKSVRDLGRDVQSIGDELKNVRVTTEPKKTGPDLMPGIALLGGFGAGIALMYFFDPEQGNRRRALLRDQITKWTRITRETASGKAQDFRNRSVGVMHEARKAVEDVTESGEETVERTNGYETADPSTTDTWGEQPIESRIEAS